MLKKLSLRQNDTPAASESATLSPLSPGLTICAGEAGATLGMARELVEYLVRLSSTRLGVPMPAASKTVSLVEASQREIEFRATRLAAGAPHKVPQQLIRVGTLSAWDALSEAGMHEISSHLAPKTVVTATCRTSSTASQSTRIMDQLHGRAHDKGAWVILFVPAQNLSVEELAKHYDILDVTKCDTWPNEAAALRVRVVGISDFVGSVNTDCHCRMGFVGGQLKVKTAPYVASSLEDVAMWRLRQEGLSLAEIAKLCGKDKSTVFRHLQPLRAKAPVDWKSDWLNEVMLAALEWPAGHDKARNAPETQKEGN